MKNPNWKREELILALDVYFSIDYGQMHGKHPAVVKLSTSLKRLNLFDSIPDAATFRSVNSVALKLANFKKFDQNFTGKGMRGIGKLDRLIWNEYHKHRDTLHNEANLIKTLYLNDDGKAQPTSGNNHTDFLYSYHKNKETDPFIIRLQQENTSAVCECAICGFDYVKRYGQLGSNLLELHYNKEIAYPVLPELTVIEDFILVCSNCHSVLDKHYGLINADDLKLIIRKK